MTKPTKRTNRNALGSKGQKSSARKRNNTGKHFHAFFDFSKQANQLLELAIRGISTMRGMPPLLESLAQFDHEDSIPPEKVKEIEYARIFARLAEKEVRDDFSRLRAHTIVAVWSALESAIPSFATTWLVRHPEHLKRPVFHKLRIPVALYEGLPLEERMTLIVEEISKTQAAGQTAPGRFETLLDAVGLGGTLPRATRRDIFEISQFRNLFVHQMGVVDPTFAAACPWLRAKVGHPFKLTRRRFEKYQRVSFHYATRIIHRALRAEGKKIPPYPKEKKRTKVKRSSDDA